MTGRRLIVGGTDIYNSLFPFVARLYNTQDDEIGFCGAFVVSPVDVATACHCVEDFLVEPSALTVGVGKTLTKKRADGRLHAVRRVLVNPRYNYTLGVTHGNDMCLLELETAISNARPATVDDGTYWTNATDPDDNGAYVIGHGSHVIYGPQAKQLQMAHVHLHSNRRCNEIFGPYGPLVSSNGCADYMIYDSCSGDSGSPIILTRGATRIVVGVVSWGIDCGGYYPGVYSRIDLEFLRESGVNATIIGHDYTPLAEDCSCATGCMSNGVWVGTDCQGCDDSTTEFCYTLGPCRTHASEYSLKYPGATWRDCVEHSAPTMLPPSHRGGPPPSPVPVSPDPTPTTGGGSGPAWWMGASIVATGAGIFLVSIAVVVVRMCRFRANRRERHVTPVRVNHARSVHRPH